MSFRFGPSAASILCSPTHTGSYSIGVRVTDPQGFNATATATLTVTAPSTSSSNGGAYASYLLPAVVALAAAGIVVAFLLGRRGRKPAPAPLKPADPG